MSPPASVPTVAVGGDRLRIAILGSQGIPARYGGFETFAEQLAMRLVARGHAVTVYAEASGQVPGADGNHGGVRVRYIRRPSWGPASVLAYDCSCLWDARREYDLVYMLGYGAAWACGLPRMFGTPVWINVDGLEWARSKWGLAARWYLRVMEWMASWTASRVIADAQTIADRYMRLYPGRAPCNFIAYGADVPLTFDSDSATLESSGLQAGCYYLVVARPEPENHLLEIIQGYLIHETDWPLVIVGNVSGETSYQRRLLALRSDKVRFIGGVYDSQKLRALRLSAGCHLHGHSVGGTNPSLLEALACGNWIVAHDNPFNREVAREAADYFQTPQELAKCLDRFSVSTAVDRAARRDRARQIVSKYYDWDDIAGSYERLMLAQCRTYTSGEDRGGSV